MLLLVGEAGVVPRAVGAAGARLFSTYVTELVEQAEVLPAASCAVAKNVVVVLSATFTGILNTPTRFAVPVPAGVELQLLFV